MHTHIRKQAEVLEANCNNLLCEGWHHPTGGQTKDPSAGGGGAGGVHIISSGPHSFKNKWELLSWFYRQFCPQVHFAKLLELCVLLVAKAWQGHFCFLKLKISGNFLHNPTKQCSYLAPKVCLPCVSSLRWHSCFLCCYSYNFSVPE